MSSASVGNADGPEVARGEPVAVVTGAASGMGHAVATRFLDASWSVLGLDLREPRLDASRGRLLGWAPVDVCDRGAVREAVSRVRAGVGPLRAVLKVAGTYPPTTLKARGDRFSQLGRPDVRRPNEERQRQGAFNHRLDLPPARSGPGSRGVRGRRRRWQWRRAASKTPTIYSSLPLQGDSRQTSEDVIGGERLALEEAGGRGAGSRSSTSASRTRRRRGAKCEPGLVSANARAAALGPAAARAPSGCRSASRVA
jgi:short chain dehydrogenase